MYLQPGKWCNEVLKDLIRGNPVVDRTIADQQEQASKPTLHRADSTGDAPFSGTMQIAWAAGSLPE